MIQQLAKQRRLLEMEYEYEREQFRRSTECVGIDRHIRRGLCWFPLGIGAPYRNSLDQLVLPVTRTMEEDEEHQFEPGRPVCFFEQDASGMLHYMSFVAQVGYVDGNRMVIIMPDSQAVTKLQNAEQVGMQLYMDEYTYRLMFQALDRVIEARTGRLAELRDIIHTTAPLHQKHFAPVRFPWLNPSQEQAVNQVLWASDVAVVHGPPGTGKTTTLVEAIYETLRRETQVLVCAQSNMAVDWISEKLADRGVPVLRIGNPSRVTDRMLADTYERRFESHPQYPQLWSLRQAIRNIYDHPTGSRDDRHQRISRLKDRATAIEYEIRDALFQEARVVACTLTGSAHPLLVGRHFGTLFIDEAAQALEAACWIAIQRADRVILAGDHRQLPPTIRCPQALAGGLDRTLMQQIVEQKPQAVSLLNVQYRMSEGIMQFPNREFYEGLLTSDPSVRYRGILDWDSPMEWIDTSELSPAPQDNGQEMPEDYAESLARDGLSRQNPAEARLTLDKLKAYLERIGKERILGENIDFGLISPYQGQVRLLRQMMRRDPFWRPYRHLITIGTVDSFQGQERDVIVISMVRSNEKGNIGFLRDLRRMNVAITRARMKLLLIGDAHTLCHLPFYRRFHRYIQEEASI